MSTLEQEFAARYGPYALVTGASEGIGRSFAMELAKTGLHLVLVARRADLLQALAKTLEASYGVRCLVIAADLSRSEDVDSLYQQIQALDIGLVVCNAGFGTAGNFLDGDLPTEMNLLRVNCAAVTTMAYRSGHQLRARGKGGLVLLSSIVATQGVPRSAHYAASKAYVHTLGEALRHEWKGSGVDVLIVAPGPVATGFAVRSRMQLSNAADADVVAAESLRALGRQAVVHPGWLAKLLSLALSTAPRSLRVKIMGMVMRGMTQQLPS
ncbi:MAG: SDR family NAD(P)-dependent oxidoreductase [Betaproteobacteria bacterium]|nr:SDR family NAD(P)-dependent oxidoreductase [Betaproteobacteria bacterium]